MLWQQAVVGGQRSLARRMAAAGIRALRELDRDFGATGPAEQRHDGEMLAVPALAHATIIAADRLLPARGGAPPGARESYYGTEVMSIADLRREYNLTGLRRKDLEADPIVQFKRWFEQAQGARASGRMRKFCIGCTKPLLMAAGAEQMDLTAMTLATVDKAGPAFGPRCVAQRRGPARLHLLHQLREPQGRRSWPRTRRQRWSFIGRSRSARSASPGRSASCPPRSPTRISSPGPEGAGSGPGPRSKARSFATGRRSKRSGNRWKRNTRARKSPVHLIGAGICCAPARVEFWQGRPNRLHDRFCYTRQADKTWLIERLSP